MLSEPNISYKPFWGICRPLNSWRANSPNPIQIYCAQFYAGDGIVAHSVDETIQNIGTLGSQGMLQTNDKIIEMMISCD